MVQRQLRVTGESTSLHEEWLSGSAPLGPCPQLGQCTHGTADKGLVCSVKERAASLGYVCLQRKNIKESMEDPY